MNQYFTFHSFVRLYKAAWEWRRWLEHMRALSRVPADSKWPAWSEISSKIRPSPTPQPPPPPWSSDSKVEDKQTLMLRKTSFDLGVGVFNCELPWKFKSIDEESFECCCVFKEIIPSCLNVTKLCVLFQWFRKHCLTHTRAHTHTGGSWSYSILKLHQLSYVSLICT